MTFLLRLLVPISLLLAALLGCGTDDDASTNRSIPALQLSESGGCGDAYFWTTTHDDVHAVVVSTDLRERSTTEPTTVKVTLPDPEVTATLQSGSGLQSIMCNDLPQGEVTLEDPIVEGTMRIVVGPTGGEGNRGPQAHGEATLTDLVTESGIDLPDVTMATDAIGFYAG